MTLYAKYRIRSWKIKSKRKDLMEMMLCKKAVKTVLYHIMMKH